jgi:hypothetical protein
MGLFRQQQGKNMSFLYTKRSKSLSLQFLEFRCTLVKLQRLTTGSHKKGDNYCVYKDNLAIRNQALVISGRHNYAVLYLISKLTIHYY